MKKLFKAISLIAVIALLASVLTFSLVACNGKNKADLRFAAPDGTPALAMLTLASQGQKLGEKTVEYEVVSPSNIAAEMTSSKADIVIMPVNAGATQIVKYGVDYKLVSIAVEGSLYLVGHKDDGSEIALEDIKGSRIACIGETGVPGLVFKYIMQANNIGIVTEETPTSEQVFVEYVADGALAAERYYGNHVDFIVVGEPAATAQQKKAESFTAADLRYARRLNAEMNLQAEYGEVSGVQNADNYPQAGLFVKTSLLSDAKFMQDLFAALAANKTWIDANRDKVTAEAAKIGSTSTFPAPSIPRCALDCTAIDDAKEDEILAFLKNVAPALKWDENSDKLFALGLAG